MSGSGEKSSPLPLVLWSIVCITIVLGIIGGLMITGGPVGQRKKRLDDQRSQDLIALKHAIENYYAEQKRLPDSLQELKANIEAVRGKDLLTQKPYTYHKKSDTSLALCADFDTDTTKNDDEPYYSDFGPVYHHKAGHVCYTLMVAETSSGVSHSFRWMGE